MLLQGRPTCHDDSIHHKGDTSATAAEKAVEQAEETRRECEKAAEKKAQMQRDMNHAFLNLQRTGTYREHIL